MKTEFEVRGLDRHQYNPKQYGGMASREGVSFTNTRAVNFTAGIDTIATTEAPALVVDWSRFEVIREILPMQYCEMPFTGKVPFLDSHSRRSLDKVKGSAREFRTEGNKLMCKVFISESEPQLRQKIQEGHIDSVSVGYATAEDYTVEIPKGASVTIDGKAYRNDFTDGYPMVVRTWWQTHELSGVAIGADKDAKFKGAPKKNESRFEKKAKRALRLMEIELGIVNIDGLSKNDALMKLIKARQSAAEQSQWQQVDAINQQIKEVRNK